MHSVFKMSATAALVVSLTVDALDYLAPMLFATPILGDISDRIVTGKYSMA